MSARRLPPRCHAGAGLIGLLAGVIRALGATAAAATLAEHVFRMEMRVNPWALVVAPLLCVLVVVAGGSGCGRPQGFVRSAPGRLQGSLRR